VKIVFCLVFNLCILASLTSAEGDPDLAFHVAPGLSQAMAQVAARMAEPAVRADAELTARLKKELEFINEVMAEKRWSDRRAMLLAYQGNVTLIGSMVERGALASSTDLEALLDAKDAARLEDLGDKLRRLQLAIDSCRVIRDALV